MSRWKRVALSFACALSAALLVSAALSRLQYGSDWKLKGIVLGAATELYLVLPCWLVVLPMVICFDELRSWKLWLLAGIGTVIGPLVMFCIIATTSGWSSDDLKLLTASLGVSLLTTVSYIMFVKLDSRRIQPTT